MLPEVPGVEHVLPLDDFGLLLTFSNGKQRVFSVKPYLDKGIFTELRNTVYFRSVRAESGFISWPHEQDFSPETLYLKSRPVEQKS